MSLDKVKVEKFIKYALYYEGNLYSQPKRLTDAPGKNGYSDCSSIIQKPLTKLGWNTRPAVAVTTHRMGIEGDSRFREIDLGEIKRGDLVWWHKYTNNKYEGHVGVFLGNGKVLEAIYSGVSIQPISRLAWQRAYRIVALEDAEANIAVEKVNLKGTVSVNVLNVRDNPSTNGNIVGKLYRGTELRIIGRSGSWFQIGEGRFISGAYIDLNNDKPIENIPILINGKEIKRGYIISGVTYMTVGGKDKPVRKIFEAMGADVRWQDNKVQISL